MAQLLYGKPVADALTADTRRRADLLRDKGVMPKLVILRCGENEADGAYIRGAMKRGGLCGVDVELRTLAAARELVLVEAVEALETGARVGVGWAGGRIRAAGASSSSSSSVGRAGSADLALSGRTSVITCVGSSSVEVSSSMS